MSCGCGEKVINSDHSNTTNYMNDKPWLAGISYNLSSKINDDYPNQCAWYYARNNWQCNTEEGIQQFNGSREASLRNRYDWALSSHYCAN